MQIFQSTSENLQERERSYRKQEIWPRTLLSSQKHWRIEYMLPKIKSLLWISVSGYWPFSIHFQSEERQKGYQDYSLILKARKEYPKSEKVVKVLDQLRFFPFEYFYFTSSQTFRNVILDLIICNLRFVHFEFIQFCFKIVYIFERICYFQRQNVHQIGLQTFIKNSSYQKSYFENKTVYKSYQNNNLHNILPLRPPCFLSIICITPNETQFLCKYYYYRMIKPSKKLSKFIFSAVQAISSQQSHATTKLEQRTQFKQSTPSRRSNDIVLLDLASLPADSVAVQIENSTEPAKGQQSVNGQAANLNNGPWNYVNANYVPGREEGMEHKVAPGVQGSENGSNKIGATNIFRQIMSRVVDKLQNSLTLLSQKLSPPEQPRLQHRQSKAIESLSRFIDYSLPSIRNKNSNSFDLFGQKLSRIKHVESIQMKDENQDIKVLKQAIEETQPKEKRVKTERMQQSKAKSSTKSIRLDYSNDEEEPFNLTLKTRVQNNSRAMHESVQNNDSLAYSHSQFTKMDSFERRVTSPDRRAASPVKKSELEQIQDEEFIPKELKYTLKDLQPDSPKKQYLEQIVEPTRLELVKKEVEEMRKKHEVQIEGDAEEVEEDEEPRSYQQHLQPENSEEAVFEISRQAHTVNVTQSQPQPSQIPSTKSLRKHKVRLQKELQDSKSYRQSSRVDSIQSRMPSQQSLYPSRKRIASNDNKYTQKSQKQHPPSGNIFSTEIETIKQRIQQLHEAKSRKKFLEIQLSDVNNEISNLKRADDSQAKKNKIREFIGISDDHEARVRAAQLVNKLNKEKAKRQRSIIEGFSKVDNSILDSINELAKIREEREKKVKEQKKIQILERMKQHQRKKAQSQKLQQANKLFVFAIKNDNPLVHVTKPDEPQTMPQSQRYRKQPTQHSSRTPDIRNIETPELNSKKERLRKVRRFNYVSKKSILEDYNASLF